jgi:glycosyltransferase involved in cell wall biosynthesis
MNILVIAPFMPWPLAHGGRIRLYHLVRELARQHRVTLVALAEEPAADTAPLEEFCRVVTVPHQPGFLPAFWRFLAGPRPYNVERFASPRLTATIRRLLESERFDLVHLETTHIWGAAAACGDLPLVLGTQNVESTILAQLAKACRNPLKRLLYRLEGAKMHRFETDAWRSCRLCLAVSDAERAEMIAAGVSPDRVVTIPNGVDLERFTPAPRPKGKRLLFLGGLDYHPNRDAADWLLTEVWPLVRVGEPAAQLLIAGRGTEELAAAGLPRGVACLGDPADVPACFAQADMLLVPLRIGAGTRLKVLEAMAAGLPVVATARGCEGIAARTAEQLLVADTPADFAAACLRLLTEPGLAERLAANARRLVEARYSWRLQGERLAGLYGNLCGGERRS